VTDAPVVTEFPALRSDGHAVDGVALVTINRPTALNALNAAVMDGLASAFEALDADASCHAITLRGSGERAFAAGADIKGMVDATPSTIEEAGGFANWLRLRAIGLPIIAAVRGFALGGGCELALLCDLIVAGDDAQFGQPELRLGIIPGAGGTQRLTRAVGKARASELILTGRTIDAAEAERIGLVSRVVPATETFDTALDIASKIAGMPPLAVRAAKAAIAQADEVGLTDGLAFEQRTFFGLFATDDQQEGMRAFIEKRPPVFRGR
jgi:enoyl-CoA hydratase/carnithine racemase